MENVLSLSLPLTPDPSPLRRGEKGRRGEGVKGGRGEGGKGEGGMWAYLNIEMYFCHKALLHFVAENSISWLQIINYSVITHLHKFYMFHILYLLLSGLAVLQSLYVVEGLHAQAACQHLINWMSPKSIQAMPQGDI